jgi:hypothetical protein
MQAATMRAGPSVKFSIAFRSDFRSWRLLPENDASALTGDPDTAWQSAWAESTGSIAKTDPRHLLREHHPGCGIGGIVCLLHEVGGIQVGFSGLGI